MMKRAGRTLLVVTLTGFLLIGALLFTGHWGLAIKASNYLYSAVLISLLVLYFSDEKI